MDAENTFVSIQHFSRLKKHSKVRNRRKLLQFNKRTSKNQTKQPPPPATILVGELNTFPWNSRTEAPLSTLTHGEWQVLTRREAEKEDDTKVAGTGGPPAVCRLWLLTQTALRTLQKASLARSQDTRLTHRNSFAFLCNNSKQLESEMFQNTIYNSIPNP